MDAIVMSVYPLLSGRWRFRLAIGRVTGLVVALPTASADGSLRWWRIAALRPEFAVEETVVNGFAEVFGVDRIRFGEIGDRSCHAEHFVVRPS